MYELHSLLEPNVDHKTISHHADKADHQVYDGHHDEGVPRGGGEPGPVTGNYLKYFF